MIRFFLPKERIQPILTSIVAFQQRDDLSGKFARKLARQRRRLAPIEEIIVDETTVIQERHKRRDAEGNVIPVLLLNAAHQVVFEKDPLGRETETPSIVPGRFHPIDQSAYDKEIKEFGAEVVTVEVEPFTEEELDAFKKVRGTLIDDLIDLLEASPYTRAPGERSAVEEADDDEDEDLRTAP